MNEKFSNKLLAIPIALCFSIIFIFCFFCIGLSKVEAASFNENLYWDAPTWIQYYSGEPFATNGSTSPGQSVLQACNKTPYCLAPDGFPKYALIGYNITDNTTNSTISAFENGDKFKFQVKLDYMLQSTAINHYVDFDFKITSGNSVYNAYCDSGEKLDINYVEQDERYEINYTCDVFNVDRSVRYFMFQLYTSNDLFYSVGVLDNFSVIVTPLDAGDIIANQNQNAQDIMNNQNQNAQDIMNNQNQNTDKVVDAIEKSEETNQGILETITNFFSNFFDGLIGIFVPSNFDFLTGFLDTLENKLGFIASVPIQFLEFLANLVTIDFDTVSSVTLPHFEILGYTFIDEQEIDLSEIMSVFQPYRIYTNIGCVCLCIRYLMKLYENFANKE